MAASEEYIPQVIAAQFRRQALRVWIVGLGVVMFWLVLILVPPIAKADGMTQLSAPLYKFFSYICHQIPSRSFFIDGEPFGVCSRCFGVYFGLVLGYLIYPLWRKIDEIEPVSKVWLFAACVPIAIDWALTFFGIWENTFLSRFITGLILGAACSTFIVPATVEITRNFTWKRFTKQQEL
ncbi:MAG: DUF2085 domain-containing protein [Acidobacteria bacterium ACB1]|nr:hypothetical protein [Pyrinomonadaceae bacterium]MCE7961944.1 DUF2085 domain-containing protein [Acidobacteria bacterium ACB1]RIJ94425.1 MAG: hypothetical protein DCC44_04530 [Acidobacteriota bacterium]